eukprot:scaffold16402_cov86-Skeletonema_dohrnii-CCMP3373.AAC.1
MRADGKYQATVCVFCDRSIIGEEKVCLKSKERLEENRSRLSVQSYYTKPTVSYGYILNSDSECPKLVDVIGKYSTYDAVAKLFGGYFDDVTFSDIAEENVQSKNLSTVIATNKVIFLS